MHITLRGLEDVQKQMERIERASKNMGEWKVFVGSRLPYAWGIEFGSHRQSGKLARRAGGSFYLRRAVDSVLAGADRDMSEGLNKVTAPGVWLMRRLGLWARRLAKVNAPRGGKKEANYRLYRSIKTEVRKS